MVYDGEDTYTLSTGRQFYAVNGILGLSADVDEYVFYGRDGGLHTDDPQWTAEERQELADEMIRRWEAWKRG